MCVLSEMYCYFPRSPVEPVLPALPGSVQEYTFLFYDECIICAVATGEDVCSAFLSFLLAGVFLLDAYTMQLLLLC